MAKAKGGYVDGFVLTVPKKNIATYKKLARLMAKACRKYGALDYKECMGDDLNPKSHGMAFTRFPKMAKARKGETVWFSFVVYKSRKHRDEVNAKLMKDPMMNDPKMKDMPMPFDMKRMAFGGFTVEVEG